MQSNTCKRISSIFLLTLFLSIVKIILRDIFVWWKGFKISIKFISRNANLIKFSSANVILSSHKIFAFNLYTHVEVRTGGFRWQHHLHPYNFMSTRARYKYKLHSNFTYINQIFFHNAWATNHLSFIVVLLWFLNSHTGKTNLNMNQKGFIWKPIFS